MAPHREKKAFGRFGLRGVASHSFFADSYRKNETTRKLLRPQTSSERVTPEPLKKEVPKAALRTVALATRSFKVRARVDQSPALLLNHLTDRAVYSSAHESPTASMLAGGSLHSSHGGRCTLFSYEVPVREECLFFNEVVFLSFAHRRGTQWNLCFLVWGTAAPSDTLHHHHHHHLPSRDPALEGGLSQLPSPCAVSRTGRSIPLSPACSRSA